jgi:hypothetical protein
VNNHRTSGSAVGLNHQKIPLTAKNGTSANWNFCADRRERAR